MTAKRFTRLRKLTFTWIGLSFLFLASAVVLLITAQIWRSQGAQGQDKHTLRRLTIGVMDLNTATVLGIFIIVCFVLGVFGFVQGFGPGKGNNSMGLVVFNWSLIATGIVTVVVASIIWFFTLTERKDYLDIWLQQPVATQNFLQETLSCCGYFNASTAGTFSAGNAVGICASITNATAIQGCVTPVTAFADFFLNNVFTTIYGFSAIQVCLFATTACLIICRREEERFRAIDTKYGTIGGFV